MIQHTSEQQKQDENQQKYEKTQMPVSYTHLDVYKRQMYTVMM